MEDGISFMCKESLFASRIAASGSGGCPLDLKKKAISNSRVVMHM